MAKKNCWNCKFLEEQENVKGWYYCPKKDWKIHMKWAVNPPPNMPSLINCDMFCDKNPGKFRCYNDPEYYKKLKE